MDHSNLKKNEINSDVIFNFNSNDHTEKAINLSEQLISYNENEDTVYLKSPTTGQVIRIRNPKAKISSSENALMNLKHVEAQIKSQTVLPDFGYMQDNYIIDRG
jgi:Na+-translocating ferredoxin:NAD+ oxidoreductase RnfC subunit